MEWFSFLSQLVEETRTVASWGMGVIEFPLKKGQGLRSRLPGKEPDPKPPEPRKYEKNTKKKYKIPHPGSGPKNTKKIPKKYENGPKMTIFVFFRYFFRIFGARPWVGDFVFFFRNFFVFSGFRGFWALYQASGIVRQGRLGFPRVRFPN